MYENWDPFENASRTPPNANTPGQTQQPSRAELAARAKAKAIRDRKLWDSYGAGFGSGFKNSFSTDSLGQFKKSPFSWLAAEDIAYRYDTHVLSQMRPPLVGVPREMQSYLKGARHGARTARAGAAGAALWAGSYVNPLVRREKRGTTGGMLMTGIMGAGLWFGYNKRRAIYETVGSIFGRSL